MELSTTNCTQFNFPNLRIRLHEEALFKCLYSLGSVYVCGPLIETPAVDGITMGSRVCEAKERGSIQNVLCGDEKLRNSAAN